MNISTIQRRYVLIEPSNKKNALPRKALAVDPINLRQQIPFNTCIAFMPSISLEDKFYYDSDLFVL